MIINYQKIKHLGFCEKCGKEKELSLYILHFYIATGLSKSFYCDQCGHETPIPKYIADYAKELRGWHC